MAQPITCDTGDGTIAFALVTQQGTGDVTALCAPCLIEWAQGVLQASGRLDDLVAQAVEAMMAAAPDNRSAPARPRKTARGASRPAPQDTPTGDESTAEAGGTPEQ